MTEQTWKERFEQEFCKLTDLLASDYSDPSEDEETAKQIFDFMEAELATARADGAAEEQNKLVKIIEEQIGRIPTNGGIMDIFMGDDGFIGKWIDRDILLEDLTTKEHHAS